MDDDLLQLERSKFSTYPEPGLLDYCEMFPLVQTLANAEIMGEWEISAEERFMVALDSLPLRKDIAALKSSVAHGDLDEQVILGMMHWTGCRVPFDQTMGIRLWKSVTQLDADNMQNPECPLSLATVSALHCLTYAYSFYYAATDDTLSLIRAAKFGEVLAVRRIVSPAVLRTAYEMAQHPDFLGFAHEATVENLCAKNHKGRFPGLKAIYEERSAALQMDTPIHSPSCRTPERPAPAGLDSPFIPSNSDALHRTERLDELSETEDVLVLALSGSPDNLLNNDCSDLLGDALVLSHSNAGLESPTNAANKRPSSKKNKKKKNKKRAQPPTSTGGITPAQPEDYHANHVSVESQTSLSESVLYDQTRSYSDQGIRAGHSRPKGRLGRRISVEVQTDDGPTPNEKSMATPSYSEQSSQAELGTDECTALEKQELLALREVLEQSRIVVGQLGRRFVESTPGFDYASFDLEGLDLA